MFLLSNQVKMSCQQRTDGSLTSICQNLQCTGMSWGYRRSFWAAHESPVYWTGLNIHGCYAPLLHDYDSPFCGLIAVNVVYPCACPANDLQFLSCCDDISSYLCGWPNNKSVIILKMSRQIVCTNRYQIVCTVKHI